MSNWTLTLDRPVRGGVGRDLHRRATSRAIVALDTVLLWLERADQRRRLAALDAHLLKDIGIGRAEAEREAGKPFWQP